jgi:peptidoglycan hydrolase-like protein with peptidoglycan-binding domain
LSGKDKATGGGVEDGGLGTPHPAEQEHSLYLAPSTSAEFNVIRAPLVPIGCWRLEDIRFEFDSSFINPSAAGEFKNLASLAQGLPGAPLSIFGHADPVGNDVYNKTLSGRRAIAVYGLLVRDTDLWETLYSTPTGGDNWKEISIPIILQDLGYAAGSDSANKEGIRQFQTDNKIPVSGNADKDTRAKLFLCYMDKHCRDENDKPFKVEKTGFLARGEDKDGKGDYQGCGEFNPILMFSKAEDKEHAKAENKETRNAENAPNRRVLVFLFPPGSYVTYQDWPCPRAKEGISKCQLRFWSDWKKRREFQDNRREYKDTQDTFACRFYDRLGSNSPCEYIPLAYQSVDLYFQRYPGTDAAAGIQGLDYEYTCLGSLPIRGTTGKDGKVRIRVPKGESANLKVLGTEYKISVGDALEPHDQVKGMQQRLFMLGYEKFEHDGEIGYSTEYAILNFQADHDPLRPDGIPSDAVKVAIRDMVGE